MVPDAAEHTGLGEIYQERKRQIDAEGFTDAHDDAHENGELLAAAVLYRQFALGEQVMLAADGAPIGWPFEPEWWKTDGGPRRTLARIGSSNRAVGFGAVIKGDADVKIVN